MKTKRDKIKNKVLMVSKDGTQEGYIEKNMVDTAKRAGWTVKKGDETEKEVK